jgi:hypothetical protein
MKYIPIDFRQDVKITKSEEIEVNATMSATSVANVAKRRFSEAFDQPENSLIANIDPNSARSASDITRVTVTFNSMTDFGCIGFIQLKAELSEVKAELSEVKLKLAEATLKSNMQEGRVLIRDVLQERLHDLKGIVRESLPPGWTKKERLKCSLSSMALAYKMYRGESIKKYQLGDHQLNLAKIQDIVDAMQNQLRVLGLTMDDFDALNRMINDIASSVHSRIEDIALLRQKLTDLEISEADRGELIHLLNLSEKIPCE